MAKIFIGPANLRGEVAPPPSKSIAHRVLIAAALAQMSGEGVSVATGICPETSDDLAATTDCLKALFTGGSQVPTLNCRESGSTLRFLIPVAAALGKEALFTGLGRLGQRPLREYGAILAGKGITLEFGPRSGLPLRISGMLHSGRYYVPGAVSSQYVTGLLLALPLLAGDSEILLTSPLQSAPYVGLTEMVLAQFGIVVEPLSRCDGSLAGWKVPGAQSYRMPTAKIHIEADYSQAAFWLVAVHLGHGVMVRGLNPASLQGDRAVVRLLALLRSSGDEVEIDASQIPDLVPPLSVAASFRPARTIFTEAGRLRLKESDRLEALAHGLGQLGVQVEAQRGCLIITGGRPVLGGSVSAHNDHRIAMALAIAATRTQEGVVMDGGKAVNKSYPNFFADLRHLGGVVRELHLG